MDTPHGLTADLIDDSIPASTSPKGTNMSMSRKDYLAFAMMIRGGLKENPPGAWEKGYGTWPRTMLRAQLLSLAWDMAEIFSTDNPNFDEDRFMASCGFDYIPEGDKRRPGWIKFPDGRWAA